MTFGVAWDFDGFELDFDFLALDGPACDDILTVFAVARGVLDQEL